MSSMKVIRLASTLVVLLLSGTSLAAEDTANSTIAKVYPHGDGTVVLTLTNPTEAAKCSGSAKYFRIKENKNGVTLQALKNMLATALAAKLGNIPVGIAFEAGDGYCYINRIAMGP